jgi:hypothetical protein
MDGYLLKNCLAALAATALFAGVSPPAFASSSRVLLTAPSNYDGATAPSRSKRRTSYDTKHRRDSDVDIQTINKFVFYGNKIYKQDQLLEPFLQQVGKPQNLSQLDQSISDLEELYHSHGYELARVVDVREEPADIVNIVIDEGLISDVKIVGNHKTKDYVIRRYLKQIIGHPFNRLLLIADLRKLFGQGYFSAFHYTIQLSTKSSIDASDRYVLLLFVDEKRSSSVGLGGSYGDGLFAPYHSAASLLNFNGQLAIPSQIAPIKSLSFGMSFGIWEDLPPPIPGSDRYLIRQLGDSWLLKDSRPTFCSLGSFMRIHYVQRKVGGALPTVHGYRFNGVWYEEYRPGELDNMSRNLVDSCRLLPGLPFDIRKYKSASDGFLDRLGGRHYRD